VGGSVPNGVAERGIAQLRSTLRKRRAPLGVLGGVTPNIEEFCAQPNDPEVAKESTNNERFKALGECHTAAIISDEGPILTNTR